MATVADTSGSKQNLLVRSIVVAGLIIFVLHLLDSTILFTQVFKTPLIIVTQFIAAGLLGGAAYMGGIGTALLGLFLHLVISLVVAAVFLVAVQRLSVLRRNVLIGAVLYSIAVHWVLLFVVIPLSAIPAADPPPPLGLLLIWGAVGHFLTVGLPLVFVARRNLLGSE